MPQITLDTIKSFVNYLTVQGVNREFLLAHVNLTEQQLNQSNQLITTDCYELLFLNNGCHL